MLPQSLMHASQTVRQINYFSLKMSLRLYEEVQLQRRGAVSFSVVIAFTLMFCHYPY